jgi:hypothetical protein
MPFLEPVSRQPVLDKLARMLGDDGPLVVGAGHS